MAAVDGTGYEVARLDPRLTETVAALIAACRAAGWPVVIRPLGGLRTPAQQRDLVARGLSKAPNSRHLYGLAFDLDLDGYPRSAGMVLWRYLGQWWMDAGLTWGGTFGDFGHFEV